jgi:hypothetical protein
VNGQAQDDKCTDVHHTTELIDHSNDWLYTLPPSSADGIDFSLASLPSWTSFFDFFSLPGLPLSSLAEMGCELPTSDGAFGDTLPSSRSVSSLESMSLSSSSRRGDAADTSCED